MTGGILKMYFKMSKVVGCKLEQQSTELNFNFYKGSCQTFRRIFDFVLLPDWLKFSKSQSNLNKFENRDQCTYPKSLALFRLFRESRLSYVSRIFYFYCLNFLLVLMEQNLAQLGQVKYLIARLLDWRIIVEML